MKLLVLCNDRMALPALNKLIQTGMVAGVGMRARDSEVHFVVKALCNKHNVPLKLFDRPAFAEDITRWVRTVQPDAVLVKTFPWKIPAEALMIPLHGFINFHYAPLPAYRGANPLFWMVKDGAKETGVTVHRMTDEFDAGPVLFTSAVPIHPGITFGMICSQLAYSGMELSDKLLQALNTGALTGTVQETSAAGWYQRPQQQDLWIDWNRQDAESVRRLVNACNPWNKGAACSLNGWMLGLTYVTPVHLETQATIVPGTVCSVDQHNGLCIACAENTAIRVDVVYTEEGFMPGFALASFGLAVGQVFSQS